MKNKEVKKDAPKVLGLDVSTKCIGFALFEIDNKNLLELTHISPVPKPKVENKIEELIKLGISLSESIKENKNKGTQEKKQTKRVLGGC